MIEQAEESRVGLATIDALLDGDNKRQVVVAGLALHHEAENGIHDDASANKMCRCLGRGQSGHLE